VRTTDPSTHRLQRQDAKSRKTFKIKRHRSTIKGNIIRSSTVKARVSTGVTSPMLVRSPVSLTKMTFPHDGFHSNGAGLEILDRITSQDEMESTRPAVVDENTEGKTLLQLITVSYNSMI